MHIQLFLRDNTSRQTHVLGRLRLVQLHSPEGGWFEEYELMSVDVSYLKGVPGRRVYIAAQARTHRGDRADITSTLEFRDDRPLVMCVTSEVRFARRHEPIDTILGAELAIPPILTSGDTALHYWSFQGGTYPERPDWILPLRPGYTRENFQGMNAADYGGGIPLVDVWCPRWGIALGSLSPVPAQNALPVRVGADGTVGVALREPDRGEASGLVKTTPLALIVHRGDYFNALRTYAGLMRERGVTVSGFPSGAYDVEWCAWGYGRAFVPQQILATLPKAREIGARWATVDDGWQNADGDWLLDRVKFPAGDPDMRKLVDSIHAAGLKARLWWVPLEAHDSAYSAVHFPSRTDEFGMTLKSQLSLDHPDWFQLNRDGTRTQVSWWNSYTLCPAVPAVREHYRQIVTRMIRDWGYDGLKIDGQNLNAVPPCYNAAHHHASPEDAPVAVPAFFGEIMQTVQALKPEAVIQICACGTVFSLYNMPFLNQPVGSDPLTGWQVRLRGKAYKALMGPRVPYSGDHVELTSSRWDASLARWVVTGAEDFASTIGVGGVPSTKCTLPSLAQPDSSLMLTVARDSSYRRWISAYLRERPSEGIYRNLYDIAFDRPEVHAIDKDGVLYYAIFADSSWSGPVQLRGLSARSYDVIDYVDQSTVAQVQGPEAVADVTVEKYRLLKAVPR